jgi:hypothetical protein
MNKFSLTVALSLCAIVALLICINFKEPSTAPKALWIEMSELEAEIETEITRKRTEELSSSKEREIYYNYDDNGPAPFSHRK